MRNNEPARRDLLKIIGAGAASASLPLIALTSNAQSTTAHNTGVFDINAFGATGDGKTIDTPAIDRAIEAAAAAGGGTVRFPAGNYLSYSIHLKSNVALYLESGAKIIAADPPGYDAAEPNDPWEHYQDFGHNHWHNSLLWGERLENVAILGTGLIWGKGLAKGYGPGPRAEQPGVGNKAIALKNCRNVLLRDFSILHGGHFGVLATGVDNLTIDNLKIDTNRDGMDIDCCRNVRVLNCSVNSPWDDGICLKSSYALGEARSTDMVTVTNCLVSGSFEEGSLLDGTYKRFAPDFRVPRTGRIKFGTESNGGFRNITISNCAFDGCQGIALESVDGALLEDVTITNISMRDIVSAPIFVRLGHRMRGPEGRSVGSLQRVIIGNIVCYNAGSLISSIINGVAGHPVQDMKIHDVYIQHQGGGGKETAAIEPPDEERDHYPDPGRFGPTPSHGFFIRHVKNLEMSNIEISPAKEDRRPAFVLNDVQGADFFRIKAPPTEEVPTFALNNVEDFTVARAKGLADTHLDRVDRKTL
jgi:polygalacturonase